MVYPPKGVIQQAVDGAGWSDSHSVPVDHRSSIDAAILSFEHGQQVANVVGDWFQGELAEFIATGKPNSHMWHTIHVLHIDVVWE